MYELRNVRLDSHCNCTIKTAVWRAYAWNHASTPLNKDEVDHFFFARLTQRDPKLIYIGLIISETKYSSGVWHNWLENESFLLWLLLQSIAAVAGIVLTSVLAFSFPSLLYPSSNEYRFPSVSQVDRIVNITNNNYSSSGPYTFNTNTTGYVDGIAAPGSLKMEVMYFNSSTPVNYLDKLQFRVIQFKSQGAATSWASAYYQTSGSYNTTYRGVKIAALIHSGQLASVGNIRNFIFVVRTSVPGGLTISYTLVLDTLRSIMVPLAEIEVNAILG